MVEQASYPTNDGTVAKPDLDDFLDLQDLDSAATVDATLPSANGGEQMETEDLLMFFDEDEQLAVDSPTPAHEPVLTPEPTDVHDSSLLDMSTPSQELALVQESTPGQAINDAVEAQDEEMREVVPKTWRNSSQDTGMINVFRDCLTCKANNPPTAPDTPTTAFGKLLGQIPCMNTSTNPHVRSSNESVQRAS